MALPGSARPLQIPCLDGGLHALRPCSIALLVFGVLFQLAELLPIELAKRPLSPSIAYVGLRIVVFSLLIGLSDLNPRSVTRPVTGMAAMECCNAAYWASSHGGSGPITPPRSTVVETAPPPFRTRGCRRSIHCRRSGWLRV
jgi:hypothetical protein